jgi:hypothetical protein
MLYDAGVGGGEERGVEGTNNLDGLKGDGEYIAFACNRTSIPGFSSSYFILVMTRVKLSQPVKSIHQSSRRLRPECS